MKSQSPDLVHNMSAPAKTTIHWDAPARRPFGFGIVVALPEDCLADCANQLLQQLEIERRRTAKAAEEELRRRIRVKALELPLPPVAAISAQAYEGDFQCTDLLTIITVLAKSSSHVYLRDKEPNLASIVHRRRLVLIVPKEVRI